MENQLQKKKEVDNLELEQWAYVIRFKNWKTSLRREVTTGSTHARQVTDCSSETDLAASTQELENAGSVFGCAV